VPTSAAMTTPAAGSDDTRIPAVFPVRLQFRAQDGAPIVDEVWSASTRDVSRTGLSLRGIGDREVVVALSQNADSLRVDVDLDIGRRTVRVASSVQWLKVANPSTGAYLIGVAFEDADAGMVDSIVEYARRVHHRPAVTRAVLATAVVAALVIGGLYWRAAGERQRAVAEVEGQLHEATEQKQAAALEVERKRREVERLKASTDTKDEELATKENQLSSLRAEFDTLRNTVGELAVSAEAVAEVDAPPEPDAAYHLGRARVFAKEEDNLEAALVEYNRAVELDPELSEAYLEIANINDLFGRYKEAIAAYRRYLQLVPDTTFAEEIGQRIEDLRAESAE